MQEGYIELTDIIDTVSIDGGEQIPANELNGTGSFAIVNGGVDYYPDLKWSWDSEETPTATVNGNPVTVYLIGGAHPSTPPPRPK